MIDWQLTYEHIPCMLEHMKRTTIRLDDDLMRQAKRFAAERGITLTALIEGSLRERLARKPEVVVDEVVLPSFGSPDGRLMPGVDFADNASLRKLMDADTPIERLR